MLSVVISYACRLRLLFILPGTFKSNYKQEKLLILIVAAIISSTDSSLQARQFAGGTGTQADPYQVATATHLDSVRNYTSAHFRQTADISLQAYRRGEGWLPIVGFSGSYDGGGFTISRLRSIRGDDVGLFGTVISGGSISNLTLDNPLVEGDKRVGSLVGSMVSGSLSNITLTTGSVLARASSGFIVDAIEAGGLVGKAAHSSFQDIRVTGTSVNANISFAGGVVGSFIGSISRARVTGVTVYGGEGAGGIAGTVENHASRISESAVIGGSVSGINEHIGGLVGLFTGGVGNSYSTATVMGTTSVLVTNPGTGGLVGTLSGGWISSSYAAGLVTGTDAGGLLGRFSAGNVYNSYYNSDSTATSGGGTGLSTAQMQQQASFTGFNFDTTWVMLNEGGAFPELQALVDASTLFSGGTGTQGDPFQVATDIQLNSVRFFPTSHYRQTADINLNAYRSGDGWLPIPGFSGSYDGGGFTISRLRIVRTTSDSLGLFATVGSGGSISNLTLSNPVVSGNSFVGSLVGRMTGGSLSNITVTSGATDGILANVGILVGRAENSTFRDLSITGGTVNGLDQGNHGGVAGGFSGSMSRVQVSGVTVFGTGDTGGITGHLFSNSQIRESVVIRGSVTYTGNESDGGGLVGLLSGSIVNSYSTTTVSGPSGSGVGTGGLVGEVEPGGAISTSYAAGPVTGTGAGGLAGVVRGGVTSSYYNSDSTATSGGGTGLSTVQMQQQASFTGFNFDTTWVMLNEGGAFPELQAFVDVSTLFSGGAGTQGDPFQVATDVQLNSVRLFPAAHYRQTADISLNAYRSGDGWLPIPGFSGSYDGGGFTISRLRISRFAADSLGLFGTVRSGGSISNLTLSNPVVEGNTFTGSLVGSMTGGSLSNITVTSGAVDGKAADIGLLVGRAVNSTFRDLRITGGTIGALDGGNHGGVVGGFSGSMSRVQMTGVSVNGSGITGGITGSLFAGSQISESMVIGGSVSVGRAESDVGGLVGVLSGSVVNSYSTATVTGTGGGTGGLAGDLAPGGVITTSYAAGPATGTNAGGLVGVNLGGTVANSYYNSDSTATSAAGTGLNTTAMRQQASFTGFDFANIWVVPIGAFPELQAFMDVSTLFPGGTGTQGDPFLVATANQLYHVRFSPGTHFRQTANIDLNVSPYNTAAGWLPIPDITGSYDGGGFTISNLFINRPDSNNVGLFAKVTGARLTNLTLTTNNSSTVTGNTNTGLLAGLAASSCTISGIRITGGLVRGSGLAYGGLAGRTDGCSVSDIKISGIDITVTGANNAIGGLIGHALNSVISQARARTITITGLSVTGGLIGNLNSGSSVSESVVSGSDIQGDLSGGLAGRVTSGSVTNSYTLNNRISSDSDDGGLVGFFSAGSISSSYASNRASSEAKSRGLVNGSSGGTITSSYYNVDSVSTVTTFGTALTTIAMRQQASFTGWDFLTTWAIDEGSGFPDFQERQSGELVITGDEGWRMLSSPLSARSIGRLLRPLWTQGFPGADASGGSPNLYFWNEASRTWTLPGDTSFTPGSGTGFLMYVYSDDDFDGTPEGFPKRIEQTGNPFTGQRAIDLSFTDTGDSTSDGWNLAGNPYPTSINWNAGRGWTRNNLDQTFYVWSDAASNGNGAYLTWNTLGVGTKGTGKIAPWQGFWVKANAASPRIAFTDSVRNSGGVLLKQAKPVIPQLKLELEGNGLSSQSVVVFHDQAQLGKDPLDAYKLRSLNPDNYLLLGTSVSQGQVMDIQALPVSEETQEIELVIEGSDLNGQFTLNWNPEDVPGDWTAELVDTQTGARFPLGEAGSHTFTMSRGKAVSEEKESANKVEVPISPITPVIKSKKGPSRFVIRLSLVVSNEPDEDLPQHVELDQNYPNPFNPVTTIDYAVPKRSSVRLEVFDILGRKVATLVDERVEAGIHTVHFDARNLASGVYLYRLKTGNKIMTKKLTLIK